MYILVLEMLRDKEREKDISYSQQLNRTGEISKHP